MRGPVGLSPSGRVRRRRPPPPTSPAVGHRLGLGPALVGEVQAGRPAGEHLAGGRRAGRGGRSRTSVPEGGRGFARRPATDAVAMLGAQPTVSGMQDGHPSPRLTRAVTADIVACPRCPRLVAWREQVADEQAGCLPRPRSTGAGRCRASVIRARGRSSSGWPRRPTAATAPAGCSPATARATGCSARCGGPASPTSRPARRRDDGLALQRRATSPRRCGARRRPTSRRPTSGTAAAPTWCGSWPCSPSCGSSWSSASSPTTSCAGCSACGRGPASATGRGTGGRRRTASPCVCSYPPEPAEHLHRQAHRADARRRVRPGRCARRTRSRRRSLSRAARAAASVLGGRQPPSWLRRWHADCVTATAVSGQRRRRHDRQLAQQGDGARVVVAGPGLDGAVRDHPVDDLPARGRCARSSASSR